MNEKILFGKDFLWGASTSSHQVEGGNINDWSEWEKENAERLAKDARRNWAEWQHERFPEMFDEENYISGVSSDHYHRYEEDISLMKELGLTAYRFSIEWSRIEPREGEFDHGALQHYKDVIQVLRENNIEPFVTLWHWPIPLWLRDKGGILHRHIGRYFSRYADTVAEHLGEDIRFWITVNEPMVYSSHGYLKGEWPPGKKSLGKTLRAIDSLVVMHEAGFNAIKRYNPDAQVGIAKHNVYFESSQNIFRRLYVRVANYLWNERYLNMISGTMDFVGLNYYFHNQAGGSRRKKKLSDLGWELSPEGIQYVLLGLKKYRKPVYIIEDGLADADDKHREWYLKEILRNIHFAMQKGAEVEGYFHWSLLDNFEWDKGFWPRFGLIKVDYNDDLKRSVRSSAREYARIIKERGF